MRNTAMRHGIHFLENNSVTIEGFRFLGATLWTDFEFFGEAERARMLRVAQRGLNDFRLIEADPLEPVQAAESAYAIYRLTPEHTLIRHRESLAWLTSELLQGSPEHTVVVTHHCPHVNSIAKRYLNDGLTAIFGSRLPDRLLQHARLWIHGHTHDSSSYRLGEPGRSVRVVCNPRGYPQRVRSSGRFENPAFDPGLLVELVARSGTSL